MLTTELGKRWGCGTAGFRGRRRGWVWLLGLGLIFPAWAGAQPVDDASRDARGKPLAHLLPSHSDPLTKPSWVVENAYWRALADWSQDLDGAESAVPDVQQEVIDAMTGFALRADTWSCLEAPEEDPLAELPLAAGSAAVEQQVDERVVPGLNCLDKIQRRVLLELTRDPEVLVPLIQVYLDGHRLEEASKERFWLADFNFRYALWLMSRYAVEGSQGLAEPAALDEQRSLIKAVWLVMADQLRSVGRYRSSQTALKLFETVLRHDPDHRLALYWAGFLSEKYGDYSEASRYWERLAALDAGDAEVQLRLGIHRLRLHRREAGQEILSRVARGDAEPWLRIVAYEELARSLRKERSRALDIVREGLEVFPEASSLRLLLAFHLEGAWSEALAELRVVEQSWREAPDLSPRGRYDLGREGGFEASRQQVRQAVDARRPLLQAKLRALAFYWSTGTRPEIAQCAAALSGGALR